MMREARLWLARIKHEWFSDVNVHHLQEQNEPNHKGVLLSWGWGFPPKAPECLDPSYPF